MNNVRNIDRQINDTELFPQNIAEQTIIPTNDIIQTTRDIGIHIYFAKKSSIYFATKIANGCKEQTTTYKYKNNTRNQ